MTRLRLGTRASPLARWQANWVAGELTARGVDVELVPITTRGDIARQEPITQATEPGVFTKELERALLERRIDLAVHSLKDLPTVVVDGLMLAAVPPREDVRDVLVSQRGRLTELPPAAKIGTGSQRRRAQLLHVRSDLDVRPIRGNVETRLEKLDSGEYDAIVLALAGLKRLGLDARVRETFAPVQMLPAAGQGALGIETRSDDLSTRESVKALDDPVAHASVVAERSLLARLNAGCSAPVGTWATVLPQGRLTLAAAVLSLDGKQRIAASGEATLAEAELLGRQVADDLLAGGAEALVESARQH